MPLPWGLARLQARFAEFLPGPPLTRDQVELLRYDNVLNGKSPDLTDLGILPKSVELILPTYMDRFRKGGRTAPNRKAYP